MKKLIPFVMLAALFSFALTGCSGGEGSAEATTGEAAPNEGSAAPGAENKTGGNGASSADMQPSANSEVEMGGKSGGN